ncbi:MAG TPA: flagellar biosynthesis anti-sigma factor FlgM [Terracidiphilus sp.]|nr:flagellar biosynthesis anti-sigma factor FlgM [Terracidiphilus sp.]
MGIRSGLDGLKLLLGASPATQSEPHPEPVRSEAAAGAESVPADHATLSNVGSEMSQAASDDSVRMDKVAAIQSALAAGTYNVPASAVASRVMDVMLGASR